MPTYVRARCDLSAQIVEEEVGDDPIEPVDLIPDGWVRLSITRPLPSRDVAVTLAAKQALLDSLLAQQRAAGAPEDVLQANVAIIKRTTDATFAALESLTPARFLLRVDVLIADPSTDPQIAAYLQELIALLGRAGVAPDALGPGVPVPGPIVPLPPAAPAPSGGS